MAKSLKSVIRQALIITYLLLGVSLLMLIGLSFGAAFVVKFTVENQTDRPIFVTPVGTVGKRGDRYPLPVYMWKMPPILSSKRGGFEIPSGESIEIFYDMDDINFSEIVVKDQVGQLGQLIVNPNPTDNQYHAPAKQHFVINDFDELVAVPQPVLDACRNAQLPTTAPWIVSGILFGPWILFGLLSALNHAVRDDN